MRNNHGRRRASRARDFLNIVTNVSLTVRICFEEGGISVLIKWSQEEQIWAFVYIKRRCADDLKDLKITFPEGTKCQSEHFIKCHMAVMKEGWNITDAPRMWSVSYGKNRAEYLRTIEKHSFKTVKLSWNCCVSPYYFIQVYNSHFFLADQFDHKSE